MLLDEDEALRRIGSGRLRCKAKLRQLAAGPTLNFEDPVLVSTARAAEAAARIEFGFVWPNVRVKQAPTVGRQAPAAENVHRTCCRGLVARRWGSA